jgi:hypothetical protein
MNKFKQNQSNLLGNRALVLNNYAQMQHKLLAPPTPHTKHKRNPTPQNYTSSTSNSLKKLCSSIKL